jgi:hypothetical protein
MQSSDIEVVYCQPDAEYRRARGESQSHLKMILSSPAHYQAATRRRFPASAAMTIGTATHCKLLEGDETFFAQFIKKPDDIKYTTKEGREWRDANTKKTILANDGKDPQWDCVVGMTDALRQLDWFDPTQPDYRKFNELSIYWNDFGISCKARLDRVIPLKEETLVLDLKTTDNVSVDKFQSKLVDLGYDFQAAWYSHAAELAYGKPVRFIFVAVERNDPHTIDMFEVPDFMVQEARFKNEKALKILKECRKTNEWPTRQPTLKMLDYPKWYEYKSEQSEVAQPQQSENEFVPLF